MTESERKDFVARAREQRGHGHPPPPPSGFGKDDGNEAPAAPPPHSPVE